MNVGKPICPIDHVSYWFFLVFVWLIPNNTSETYDNFVRVSFLDIHSLFINDNLLNSGLLTSNRRMYYRSIGPLNDGTILLERLTFHKCIHSEMIKALCSIGVWSAWQNSTLIFLSGDIFVNYLSISLLQPPMWCEMWTACLKARITYLCSTMCQMACCTATDWKKIAFHKYQPLKILIQWMGWGVPNSHNSNWYPSHRSLRGNPKQSKIRLRSKIPRAYDID